MKRAIIVHGWGGYPEEGWFPWLKKELEARGYIVSVPKMPHAENPKMEEWIPRLSSIVGKPDANTLLIGHSIGCQTILRYLATLNNPHPSFDLKNKEIPQKQIGGAVFVAGWFNLQNIEDEEEKKIAEPWITTPIDLVRVKTSLPKSTLIISDDDPYGELENNIEKFKKLGSKIVILSKAGHINGESGHIQLPEVLTEIESL